MSIGVLKSICVDFSDESLYQYITVFSEEIYSRTIEITPLNNGEEYTIPAGTIARLEARKPDNKPILLDSKIDFTNNKLYIELTPKCLDTPGVTSCQIGLYGVDNRFIASSYFYIDVYRSALSGNGSVNHPGCNSNVVESSPEYQSFRVALLSVDEVQKRANAAILKAENDISNAIQNMDVEIDDAVDKIAESAEEAIENVNETNENVSKNELEREENETKRQQNEQLRDAAEEDRKKDFEAMVTDFGNLGGIAVSKEEPESERVVAWIDPSDDEKTLFMTSDDIAQELGDSEEKVLSQKAATRAIVDGVFRGGEIDFSDKTRIIADTGNRTRFSAIPFMRDGVITKIFINAQTNHNIRVFIGEKVDDTTIRKIGSFFVPFETGKTEYVNGVDFETNIKVKKGYLIGTHYNLPTETLYVGEVGTGTSYFAEGLFTTKEKAGFEELTYGITLGAECEAVDERVERLFDGYGNGVETPRNINYYFDSDIFAVKIQTETLTDTHILMKKTPPTNTGVNTAAECAFVNFTANEIGFYNQSAVASQTTVFKKKKVHFNFIANHQYLVEMIKENNKTATLRITDIDTFETDSISANVIDIGRGWGIRTYNYVVNSVAKTQLTDILGAYCISTQNKDSKVLIIGDSFIEGFSLPEHGEDRDSRYAMKIKKKLNGNAFINGKGGAPASEGLVWLNQYLLDICKPQYCIVALGTNDSVYNTWLTNIQSIISKLEENKITPILVTVTASTTSGSKNIFNQMNEWIRASGYSFIDANRALSLNFDGLTPNAEYLYSDGLHPNAKGHERIYKRALADVPFLFN